MTTIASTLVPLEVSFDSEVSWQTLVCLKQFNIPTLRETTSEDTYCGKAVASGVQTGNPSFTAVCEAAPSAGSQVTYGRLLIAQYNDESFKYRVKYPSSGSTGQGFFIKQSCKANDLDLIMSAEKYIEFSGTLTGEGLIDIVYP